MGGGKKGDGTGEFAENKRPGRVVETRRPLIESVRPLAAKPRQDRSKTQGSENQKPGKVTDSAKPPKPKR